MRISVSRPPPPASVDSNLTASYPKLGPDFWSWRNATRASRQVPGESDNEVSLAAVGKGPPLVKAANWLNYLEYDWQSPIWSHVLRAISARYWLIRYDERRNGLADWDVEDISLDSFVRVSRASLTPMA
jgi:hypothetical protein